MYVCLCVCLCVCVFVCVFMYIMCVNEETFIFHTNNRTGVLVLCVFVCECERRAYIPSIPKWCILHHLYYLPTIIPKCPDIIPMITSIYNNSYALSTSLWGEQSNFRYVSYTNRKFHTNNRTSALVVDVEVAGRIAQ